MKDSSADVADILRIPIAIGTAGNKFKLRISKK